MRKIAVFVLAAALLLTALCGCGAKSEFPPYHVFSEKIKSVQKVKMLTGVNAVENTQEKWDIGGTDLGFPYWDETRGKMYMWFGDTNHGVNNGSQNWRSNVLGISGDLNAADGIAFERFASTDEKNGWATEVLLSVKDSNDAEGERTVIPTGAIAINGVHYVFFMSVRTWHEIGWDVNYCGVAKSEDGENYTVLNDLFWADDTQLGKINTARLLEQDADEVARHTGKNFLQIFPYQSGEYIYIFGIPNARMGGCKLGRVRIDEVESFDSYEYYTGKGADGTPVWEKGTGGLAAACENDSAYVVEPQVGELCISYNKYLGRHVMSFYSLDRIVMVTSENLIDWSIPEIVLSSGDVPILYGGFHHEKYNEKDGKIMYFFVSQYYGDFGDDAYNVQIVRVEFK